MPNKFDQILTAVAESHQHTDANFAALNLKIDSIAVGLTAKIDTIKTELDLVKTEVDPGVGIGAKIDAIKAELDQLKNDIEGAPVTGVHPEHGEVKPN